MIELADIEAARARIAGAAVRTSLIRLRVDDARADVYLKPENLQPINSFKIRGATNAIMLASPEDRAAGLVTASAGNMAQGVAWVARELGVPATIAVPEHAPEAKLAAISRLGGTVLKLPYDEWWDTIITSQVAGAEGLFVHPVQDPGVIAGNGTIGLEILEDLPDPAGRRRPRDQGRRGRRRRAGARRARPPDRGRRGGTRRRRGAVGPGGAGQGRLRGLRRQHQLG
jgi:threonine dehydratase